MYHFVRTLFFKKRLTAWEQFLTFIKGIFMSIAVFIPGVGISTLSLVFNIYDDFILLLHDLSTIIKQIFSILIGKFNYKIFKKSLDNLISDFTIPLFFGLILGFAVFSFVFSFILVNVPAYSRAMFFGIVLASITTPFKHIKKITSNQKFISILSFGLFFYLFGLHSNNIFYAPNWLVVILTGFLSSLTFVLPGLGGSFVLVLFNTYHHFITIANDLFYSELTKSQLTDLILFVISFILGFIFVINLVKNILKKNKPTFMAALAGIMAASLRLLYPFITLKGDIIITSRPFDLPVGQSIALILVIIISFIVTKAFNTYVKFHEPVEEM